MPSRRERAIGRAYDEVLRGLFPRRPALTPIQVKCVEAAIGAYEAELAADLESDETVERAAQALYEAPAYGLDRKQTPWAETSFGHQEFDRNQWRVRARAALRSALKEER